MNPTAIYSKTGKGVQEASGKTSQLSRGDRAILSAIDGKITLKDLGAKFDRPADDKFFALIQKLDNDGFIREVSPGTVQRGAANAPKAPAGKAPGGGGGGGEELDFTQIFSAPPKMEKPPAPAAPTSKDPMVAAREAAEARARAEREAKARAEAAAKAMADAAQKERLEAEARAKAAREATMAAAAEGKTRAEMEARAAAEARAKAEAERKAKERAEQEARDAKERAARELREKAEAAERSRFEAAERARREAEELRRKVEEERRAREEAERRAREEAERTKREAEERARREAEEKRARQEADELRKKLEEERRAREEAEKKAQEERDKREQERLAELKAREEQERREEAENQRQIRLAREAEDKKRRDADARKRKEQEAKRWEQEEARRKSDDAYRQRAEQEDKERAEQEALEAAERAVAEKKAAEAADALSGSLLADLDSFSSRQDEEAKEKEEAERKARAEAEQRARREAEQREREEAERKLRQEEERRAKEEAERREKEEAERQSREAEEKKKEEAERKKKEREEKARKQSSGGGMPASGDDLAGDEVADDERRLTPEARKALRDRQREVARARGRGDDVSSKAAAAYKRKQPVSWGKPAAAALFFLLLGGVGVVNVMPLSTVEYEKLASDAVGVPVKIGAARMYALAGVQMRFERVSIGDAVTIAAVRAVPELATLTGEDKVFSRLELDGVALRQDALGEILQGGMKGKRLRVARVVAKDVKLDGPLALPAVDVDASIAADGRIGSVKLSGDRVSGLLTPKGEEIGFDVTLGNFSLPFLGGKLLVADFGMKGAANRLGMAVNELNGRLYNGTLVGNARILWGKQWSVQGQLEGRSMNAAVFAPQLVSEGRLDGKARYAMGGTDPAKLYESARLEGNFTVAKGALGSFDLARALQSTSAQASGRTPFTELEGKAALAGGVVSLREMTLSSGLLKATGSLDVDPKGALAGRINAELRTLRGTLYIGGSLTDPQLRR